MTRPAAAVAAGAPASGAGLYQPDRATFRAQAIDHVVVPVWREVLADLTTPLAVYDRLRHSDGPTFLLESVEQGERWGRYSFIGLRPIAELRAARGTVRVTGDLPPPVRTTVDAAARSGDPLAVLEALIGALRAPRPVGLPPLFTGAVGYLAYDVVRHIESLPDTGIDDLGTDDVRMVVPGQMVVFDHLRQRLLVVSSVVAGDDPDRAWQRAVDASEELVAQLAEPVRAPVTAPPQAVVVTDTDANMTRADYERSVRVAQEHIRAGDCFQVVPSHRFALDTTVDPLAVHRVLRVINPSPYMYLFDWGDLQIVGSSPEALVTVSGDTATIWPIAGSRRRGADDTEDQALEQSLRTDAKELAEHVMLVDLARNDLGRVAVTGTVEVTDFMSVVRYSHIMHLLSRVSCRLRPGVNTVDVLRASFPAGTLTGAPKVRAMEVIDDLEPTRRGIYGGGIGYVDLAGNADVCIAIRTLVFHGGRAYVQAGAGVVADSDPAREYQETWDKAMALLAAVRAAERWEEASPR